MSSDAYDVCKLLNYWVFSRLSEIYVSDNTSTAKDAFDTLDRIWNQFIKEKGRELDIKKCRPDRVLFSYNDWKKRKELYDYYVDIGPIVQFAKSISHDCDQYYKYVKYKKKIYDQYEEYCKQDNYLKCPNFFKDCINNPEIPDPKTSTGTKAGSMLRNRFGRNNHNMRNLKIGDNGLFDYVSESFNPYSGEEHYIGYQPA
ncbi:hypothetical protein PVIIG_05902 [Plasmodium vivax India VII]|uniref:Vir protein n=1 Tax=Plasmodium vivax India VII TaxID=1077284 RepID=A0A0J9S2I6_PLAVI|nr:hypothetical protein PVIIG_05902 [Plasmodium vivax India VII]